MGLCLPGWRVTGRLAGYSSTIQIVFGYPVIPPGMNFAQPNAAQCPRSSSGGLEPSLIAVVEVSLTELLLEDLGFTPRLVSLDDHERRKKH